MNIKIPYSWICDYLKTEVKPDEVFKLVTSTGPTIERIEKTDDDYILDIEVTINRPDCLSVLGIAREMYAVLKQNNLKATLVNDCLSNPPKIISGKEKIPFKFSIDNRLCPRFMGVVLSDIKIGPSPDFIVKRLEKAGMRSLNNVIDISNFLMLETGQPNHAFDFNKIKGPQFLIRPAKKGEKITTLDNQKRVLDTGDIIYEDKEKIFDLAGIMGGQASEIDNSTNQVFFTVVNLYYAQIRKTTMRLGIQTEASARLTKVLNPAVVEPVMLRGIELMQKYAGAKIKSQIFDSYPQKQKIISINTNDNEIEKLIGINIPPKVKDNILLSLGFTVKRTGNILTIIPPIWRINDVSITEDLTEEIARVYGYDKVTDFSPTFELPNFSQTERLPFILEKRVRHLLVAWGLQETLSFSMLSQRDLAYINYEESRCTKIANPLSEDWVFMQPTLVPNILKNLSLNQYLNPNFKSFEIANIFNKKGEETRTLSFGFLDSSIEEIKGVIEQLLIAHNFKNISFNQNNQINYYETSQFGEIMIGKNLIGNLGMIKENFRSNFGIKNPQVAIAEINLDALIMLYKPVQLFKQIEKYNPIVEDLSIDIPEGVNYQQVYDLIIKTQNLLKIEYLDHYENHLTLRLYYQLTKQQITGIEAKKIREGILSKLKNKLGINLH
jgi:phenylalanyl-tRNA synthetase beta chain